MTRPDRAPSGAPSGGRGGRRGGAGPAGPVELSTPGAAWAFAGAVSPRPVVRVAAVDATGRAVNSYPSEAPLAGPPPGVPYAVYLTDRRRGYRLLGFDLDPARGPVADDLAELADLLRRAGLPRQVVCASGPGGGRHVWVALASPASGPLVRDLARGLARRLPSLDTAPLTNPGYGCLRPPGAPHRLTGASQVLSGTLADLLTPAGGPAQLTALLRLLGDPAPPRPAGGEAGGRVVRDRSGHRHLPGVRQPLPAPARAALDRPPPPSADASAVLWTGLLGAARARWRLADLLPLLPTAPGLEHARTARCGPSRAARPPAEQQRLLARQWDRAVGHAAAGTGTGADPSFDPRTAAVVAAVAAGQRRAEACPGRWACPGGPSDRRVLDAACSQALAAVRVDVELDIRRLGELCGISRETARRALRRLTADGWLSLAAAADGARPARWALPPHPAGRSSTAQIETGVSQAIPRPAGTAAPAELRAAWTHRLRRRLADVAHDVFTPTPGLGHHAARVYQALSSSPRGRRELAEQLGYSPTRVDGYLHRLADAGLARPGPGLGWRRRRGDRTRIAAGLGVHGVLAARRRRHALERELFAWWTDELTWMHLPRHRKRRRRDPSPGQQVLPLPGLTTRQRHGSHPRRPDGRADYPAAAAVLAAGRVTSTAA